MNDRIKQLRKQLNLTQQQFAERIGSVQNTITGYETGRRLPSNQVITLICKTFNVNEQWLRTGEGEMFIVLDRNSRIAEWVGSVLRESDTSFKKQLFDVLSRLDESEWALLAKMADKIKGQAD